MDAEGYVDVNVFVYWLGGHPAFGGPAHSLLKKIESAPRGRYVTSSLTLYQALVIVAGLTGRSLKDRPLVEEVVGAMTSLPGLAILPLTAEDAFKAISLMEEYDLDYEDSLHLATALRSGAKEMISDDQDFDGAPLRRAFP